ncbi:MAG: hypothetical protein KDC69_05035 [Flavobacteriaceae bacterium]|nr:hypothetical protein [Flavobacteriaceae bacterium]
MSISGFKRKTIQKSYDNHLKHAGKAVKKMPESIRHIGILADSRLFGSYDISRNLSQKLNVESKNFEIIIFENLKDDFVTQHYNTFNENDFGMFGKIKAQNVSGFIASEFDLLINYSNQSSLFMNMVALLSKARFKVGFANEELHDLYDFMIAVEGNKIDVFNDELAKYLQIMGFIQKVAVKA